MSEKWSLEDFFHKMDHEGGCYELFRWGMDPADIEDPILRELWTKFRSQAVFLADVEDEIYQYLQKNGVG